MQEEGLSLEAPAPRITKLGAYRLGGVAELDGAARDATPVAWCCRNNRAASGRVGEPPWLSEPPALQPPTTVMGGGGAPKHYQFLQSLGQHIDHPREPPTTVMGGGDSPGQPKLNWLPYFINYFISSNYKSNRLL